jgi:hypothetical protein
MKEEDGEKIKKLINALDKRIKAAEDVSVRIESGVKALKTLTNEIEAKKIEVQGYLERIDGVLKAIDEALPSITPAVPPLPGGRGGVETETLYREASRMAEEGHGIDEIVEQVGLPRGEVQLIVGLKKQ